MTTKSINSSIVFYYNDTLLSKNKLKKFLLLNFLLLKLNKTQTHALVTLSLTNTTKKHKNIFLKSPFHFKTVKTHLYIPTYTYAIKLIATPYLLFQIKMSSQAFLNMIGELHSVESLSTLNYKF